MSLIGRTLGAYKIEELIGRGGMATVYKARQTSIGRDVAIKILPPHPGMDTQFVERFQIEAATIGKLQHPHILPIIDYGKDDGMLYLVMAYAGGGSLRDLLDAERISPQRTARILKQVAAALDYSHEQGIVHRDIKPGNILLDAGGNALLADFGIVKMMATESNLTGTALVGTPAYMSPEQGQGETIDGRSDIYSLAVVCYEMLTGQPPFEHSSPMKMILQHINDPLPDLQEHNLALPVALNEVIQQATAKDPADRYQTATAFAEDFESVVRAETVSVRVTSTTPAVPAGATEVDANAQAAATTNLQPSNPTLQTGQTTTIIRERSNPLVLIAGFGSIAVAILIAALLAVSAFNGQRQAAEDDKLTVTLPAQDAAGTATALALAARPTNVPMTVIEGVGNLTYSTNASAGDTVNLRVQDMPANDNRYAAWLLNTETDDQLSLGAMNVDARGDGLLVFTDPEGRMLPAYYNAIIITEEAQIGFVPSGETRYSGSVPPIVRASIEAIFVASEAGLEGGSLLAGAQAEARSAATHAGYALTARTVASMHRHAEHTINILNGTQIDYDGDGSPENPGRDVGLFFFLDAIDQAILDALAMHNTRELQRNSDALFVCSQNVRNWAQQAIEHEQTLLAADDLASVQAQASESRDFLNRARNGYDANENGSIEDFEGECGLAQLARHGILFGSIVVQEGAPTPEAEATPAADNTEDAPEASADAN